MVPTDSKNSAQFTLNLAVPQNQYYGSPDQSAIINMVACGLRGEIMRASPRLPDGYTQLSEADACERIATGHKAFIVRALLSDAQLTAFETAEGVWIGRLTTIDGHTDYYQLADSGVSESVLAPLFGAGWTLEACDTDRLTATIRRASHLDKLPSEDTDGT